jgi:hypothetical protein
MLKARLGGALRFASWVLFVWLVLGSPPSTHGQTSNTVPPSPVDANPDIPGAAARAKIPSLHVAWLAERDPPTRAALASELVDAVIHVYDEQPVDIADEVARNGAPPVLLRPASTPPHILLLRPISTLPGAHRNDLDTPGVPVFRRLSVDRVEAWVPREGWLFSRQGVLLVDAHVPRRDGTGREWFGAFLPDGRWITTDLWANDRQLTCFDAASDPRWELPVEKLAAAGEGSLYPLVGWARADRAGKRWLVSVGSDWSRAFFLVGPDKRFTLLPPRTSLWQEVYPRSMGVRGMFTALYIESDDGKDALHFSEAGHGVGVGWPAYDSAKLGQVVINGGTNNFGFWPHSHALFIVANRSAPNSETTWLFDDQGKYQGEVDGSYLADAADAQNLLILQSDGHVLTVAQRPEGPVVRENRLFQWSGGPPAMPLALYDDLKLGFFLRDARPANGPSDDSAAEDIVLARWR